MKRNPNHSLGGMAERTKNKLIYSERSWINLRDETAKSQYSPAKDLFFVFYNTVLLDSRFDRSKKSIIYIYKIYMIYSLPCKKLNINEIPLLKFSILFIKYISVILLNPLLREELDEKKLSCPVL